MAIRERESSRNNKEEKGGGKTQEAGERNQVACVESGDGSVRGRVSPSGGSEGETSGRAES